MTALLDASDMDKVRQSGICDLSNRGLTALPPEIGQLTSLQTLRLDGNRLTALPPEITQLTSLEELRLNGNRLTSLPPEITHLTSLQALRLDENGLAALPPEIGQLTSLRELTLDLNRLTALPPEITQLSSLQELTLNSNQLTSLPPEIIQLTSLQALRLDGNRLTVLPPEIIQLTSLQALWLAGNGLTALPPEIIQLTSLQELRLDGNRLTSLPAGIGQLTSLQALWLDENGLTVLPPEITQLTSLQTLHLDRNGLTSLPPEIGQLTSLQELHLDENRLTALPLEITQLTSLQALWLDENGLTALPLEIGQLTSLQALWLDRNGLTALPLEIGRLTSLQTLHLDRNGLTSLPPEIIQLTSLQTLQLDENRLTSLPPGIGQLTSLRTLWLAGNGLTALPSEIGQLTSLQTLRLSGNGLTSLPPEIAQLTSLQELELDRNGLTSLPPEIIQLTSLQELQLDGNGLTSLPPEIGQLTSLRELQLDGNGLTALSLEIAQLTSLETLWLAGNGLTALPPEIIQLTSLQELHLDENGLTSLPPEIAQLTSLQELTLNGNGLTALPPEIAQLTSLEELQLDGNGLTALPPEIGQLTSLRTLWLGGNRLTTLPVEIADQLDRGLLLKVNGNPLAEPLPALLGQDARALAVYLRSLRDGIAQFEAKVMLVGEGNVGKTSLSAALRDEVFVEERPFTHGIEIEPVMLRHPDAGEDMAIRLWDFGGQEVYRVTHQFFFSRRALYLVVWKPREGQEQNEVEGWLRRIRLRVGPGARVMIVATHCSAEQHPDLDYPRLEREFPGMLAGHFEVDNQTGRGVTVLRDAIAEEAAWLPQMGQKISSRWAAVREEIAGMAPGQPQMSFQDYAALCERHEVGGAEADTLAALMHDLGQIIYYGEDEGLQDFVVLNPEWLTKAISYVLRDGPTRASGGVLDHARLRDIWQDRPGRPGSPARHHRYFLRLMEKFDISYRLENEQRSLVAQLVPYEEPALPWDPRTPLPGRLRRLALVCELREPAPGLMAWLTVRHHQASTGRHWRTGVFLRHPIEEYASEALLELTDPARLAVEVRAPSPDHYFHVIYDSIETLIKSRWPGLTYQLHIPCPTVDADGTHCSHLLPMEDLLAWREEGEARYLCSRCRKRHDLSALLTGFPLPGQPLDEDALYQQLGRVENRLARMEGQAADTAQVIRQVLRVVSTEVDDCPTLFTLEDRQGARGLQQLYRHNYLLTLWCQHPGYWHPWEDASYEINPAREWLIRVGPYVRLIARTLQLVVPLAGSIAVASQPAEQIERASARLEMMKAIVDVLPEESSRELATGSTGQPAADMTAAQGAALRALRVIIFEHDRTRKFGGMQRVQAPSGEFLWVCPHHYAEYDPGLPSLS